MNRPNEYSKPLGGSRPESYHPACLNSQYAKDLNEYIDYLENEIKKMSQPAVISKVCECKNDDVWCNIHQCFKEKQTD
jgi:hypothetical protein